MSHNLKLAEDREQMIPDWIRSQVDTWEQGCILLQLGPILSTAVPPEEVSASTVQENIGEALRAACENRKVHPDGVDPAQSPFGESPAVIMNAINRAWEGLFALQKTSLGIKEREEDTSIPGGGPSEPSPENSERHVCWLQGRVPENTEYSPAGHNPLLSRANQQNSGDLYIFSVRPLTFSIAHPSLGKSVRHRSGGT